MSIRFLLFWVILLLCLPMGVIHAEISSDLQVAIEIDKGDDATYYNDEAIFISFRTSDEAYVVVFNIDSEGKLNLLFPEADDEVHAIPGYTTYKIPEQDDDYSLKVTGVDGEEFIVAVASAVPLRIPSMFSERTEFSVRGEVDEIIEEIAEDMLDGRDAPLAIDVCHFYIGDGEKYPGFPPFPPFPFPPCGCGFLQVISKPDGAKVYLDGKPFGKTPTVIAGIPPGKHELVVRKRCYYTVSREVFIDEGERERVKVRLEWSLW